MAGMTRVRAMLEPAPNTPHRTGVSVSPDYSRGLFRVVCDGVRPGALVAEPSEVL